MKITYEDCHKIFEYINIEIDQNAGFLKKFDNNFNNEKRKAKKNLIDIRLEYKKRILTYLLHRDYLKIKKNIPLEMYEFASVVFKNIKRLYFVDALSQNQKKLVNVVEYHNNYEEVRVEMTSNGCEGRGEEKAYSDGGNKTNIKANTIIGLQKPSGNMTNIQANRMIGIQIVGSSNSESEKIFKVYGLEKLEEIHIEKGYARIEISNCSNLKHIEVEKGYNHIGISNCPNFKGIGLHKNSNNIRIINCEKFINSDIAGKNNKIEIYNCEKFINSDIAGKNNKIEIYNCEKFINSNIAGVRNEIKIYNCEKFERGEIYGNWHKINIYKCKEFREYKDWGISNSIKNHSQNTKHKSGGQTFYI